MTFSVTLCLHQPTNLTSSPSSVSTKKTASYFTTSQFSSNAHCGSRLVKSLPPTETQRWPHTQPLIDLLKVCEKIRSIKQAKSVHGFFVASPEDEAAWYDIYELDGQLIEMVPKPVLAMIFTSSVTSKGWRRIIIS